MHNGLRPKIFVLADDLTGAAEIGGIAFMHGLSTRIVFELNETGLYPENVIIIDSNSRSLTPVQASQKVSGIAADLDFSIYDLVFKKVDSVLRGPVVPEIKALLTALNLNSVILVPANPSKKRIIRSGKYFINDIPINQTEFRFDPEYPRYSENVNELITDSSDIIATGIGAGQILANKIMIPDITSENDMQQFVSKLPDKGVLLAGASDFFKGILSVKMNLQQHYDVAMLKLSDMNHFIIGTNTESSKETIKTLTQKGYSLFRMPLSAAGNEDSFNEWISRIRKELKMHRQIVISVPDERIEDQRITKEMTARLVITAKMIVENGPASSQIFIEGGETASLFFRNMGWDELSVIQTSEEGAVSLKYKDSETITSIKPGSYRWPEQILK